MMAFSKRATTAMLALPIILGFTVALATPAQADQVCQTAPNGAPYCYDNGAGGGIGGSNTGNAGGAPVSGGYGAVPPPPPKVQAPAPLPAPAPVNNQPAAPAPVRNVPAVPAPAPYQKVPVAPAVPAVVAPPAEATVGKAPAQVPAEPVVTPSGAPLVTPSASQVATESPATDTIVAPPATSPSASPTATPTEVAKIGAEQASTTNGFNAWLLLAAVPVIAWGMLSLLKRQVARAGAKE